MRIHIIQHVPYETPGYLITWARKHLDSVTISKIYEAEWFPEIERFDLLVVLGGPMSVHDTQKYPWLPLEMDFLEKTIKKRKKVLGVCLGAQLIARVLNASVYQNPYREIGWHPVRLLREACPFSRIFRIRGWLFIGIRTHSPFLRWVSGSLKPKVAPTRDSSMKTMSLLSNSTWKRIMMGSRRC